MKNNLFIYLLFSALLVISCTDLTNESYEQEISNIEEYIKEHDYTDDDKIYRGFYIKTFSDERTDTVYPEVGDLMVTSITAYDLYGNVVNTTDSATASSAGIYYEYYVYGPTKYALEDYLYGIAIGLSYTNLGDSIEMVIPSTYIGTNYIPWVVRAKVLEIIPEDEIDDWEKNMVSEFIAGKNYIQYNDELYYKKNITTTKDSLCLSNTADLKVVARYAEFKDKYSSDSLGRMCYPIGDTDTILSFQLGYGSYSYPFSKAIDLIATNIGFKQGEQIEIVTTSTYAFGGDGISYNYYTVVPVYTPIHYIIDVDSVYDD